LLAFTIIMNFMVALSFGFLLRIHVNTRLGSPSRNPSICTSNGRRRNRQIRV
jgi:hypothetical protein